MKRPEKRVPWRYILAGLWLVFTLSLTGWWFYFARGQVSRLIELEHGAASELVRYQKMLFWEGVTLFIVIAVGGVALTYYMFREMRESRRIQEFLAAFTHEVKTPLASVRLQAEMLKERLDGSNETALLDRFLGETSRLTLQLDNSLFLANMREHRWFIESIDLGAAVGEIRTLFPDLAVELEGEATLRIDGRALACILGNICQNALTHGRATQVAVQVAPARNGFVTVTVRDNGAGFRGERRRLGDPFVRHYGGSGTGIGLFLVRHLVRGLGGEARFPDADRGFVVELIVRGEMRLLVAAPSAGSAAGGLER